MLSKKFALVAITGMLFSPLALAQDATGQSSEPDTAGGVVAGDSAFGGIASALGVSETTVAVGAAVIATSIVIAASSSGSSSGATGTVD